MSEHLGSNQLMPALLNLVAEIAVDYAISAKDLQRRLRHSLWEAGVRRGYSDEEFARLLDISKSTAKNWKLEKASLVRSLWDATRALFDEQQEWTLQEIHWRLREEFKDSRSSEWEYEVTEKLLSILVNKNMLTENRGTYARVPDPPQKHNQWAHNSDEYRSWVDMKILRWIDIALIQRNADDAAVKAFEKANVTTTRPVEDTSYSAHEFRLKAPAAGESVHGKFEELLGVLSRALDENAADQDEPNVPIHVQVLYQILGSDVELRH